MNCKNQNNFVQTFVSSDFRRYRHPQNPPRDDLESRSVRNGRWILRIDNLYGQSCVEWGEYDVTAMTVQFMHLIFGVRYTRCKNYIL